AGRAREEVEIRRRPGSRAVAEGDRPEPGNPDQPALGEAELSFVNPLAPRGLLIRADLAVAEVAHEQVARERAEALRCHGEPPWSIQRCTRVPALGDSREQHAVGAVLVDVAAAAAGDLVALVGVLLC